MKKFVEWGLWVKSHKIAICALLTRLGTSDFAGEDEIYKLNTQEIKCSPYQEQQNAILDFAPAAKEQKLRLDALY